MGALLQLTITKEKKIKQLEFENLASGETAGLDIYD